MDNSSGFVDARSREITRGRERPPKVTKGHKRESYLSQAKAKAQWDWRDGSEENTYKPGSEAWESYRNAWFDLYLTSLQIEQQEPEV